jgi:hypothetical protein
MSSGAHLTHTTSFESLRDPWQPRPASWHEQPPSEHAGDTRRPVLIGACPRSGTTLLRGILDNHPDLAMPGETNFMFWLTRHRRQFGNLAKPENRAKLAAWIVDSEGRGAKRIQGRATREEVIERMVDRGPTIGSVFAAGYEFYAERHGAQRWGDKRPGNAPWIATMFELFPNAQFINLIRDPRGAAASQVPLGWDEPEVALPSAVATWERAVQRVDLHAPNLRPDQLLDVRFEDLLRFPADTLDAILAFLGLRSSPEILTEMITSERRGQFREGWHDRLNDEIDTSAADNWRGRLEPEEIAFVEQAVAPYMDRFGYVPVAPADAKPRAHDVAELERQRAKRDRRWRKLARERQKNRLLTLGRPVAATPR